jgi:hypothetical protein
MEKQMGKPHSNTFTHTVLKIRTTFSTTKATYYDRALNHNPQEWKPVEPTVCFTVTMNYEVTGMEKEAGRPSNIPVQHTPNIKKTKMHWGQQNLYKIYTAGRVKCWQIK